MAPAAALLAMLAASLIGNRSSLAQDLRQRLDAAQRPPAVQSTPGREAEEAAQREAQAMAMMEAGLSIELRQVVLDRLPGEASLQWFQRQTGLPMVIAWPSIEAVGIDPRTPVSVSLEAVAAGRLLELILGQLDSAAAAVNPEAALIYDVTPWYVHVLTKAQANRRPMLRVYDVSSDVMVIPHFDDPPTMDLGSILSDDGGFSVEAPDEQNVPTREQRGQQLAQIIRDTIEPTIWQENGGQFSSVRYHDGRLIVNAPMYVHRQIGMPVMGSR